MIGAPPPTNVPRRPCSRQGPNLHIFTEELCEDKRALGELICLIRCILTLQDSRFNAEVDLITGYKTHSILCLPIKNHRDEVSRFHSSHCAVARGVNQTPPNQTLRGADEAPSCVGSGGFFSSTSRNQPKVLKPQTASAEGGQPKARLLDVIVLLTDPRFVPQVVGVAQAINKKSGDDGAFTDQDQKVCSVL